MKILNLYAGLGGNRKLWIFVVVEALRNMIDPNIGKFILDCSMDIKIKTNQLELF